MLSLQGQEGLQFALRVVLDGRELKFEPSQGDFEVRWRTNLPVHALHTIRAHKGLKLVFNTGMLQTCQ